ncbi:penicillin-binding protein [Fusarium subglutinans]|uniref:Penicillin-binding protein n=1 Tax=Gibberella subglutinans TaxID=42677 RepID=A0A8H5Q776_GIBSU|nr:penicillin-binding protein [Fusarium subglutinans]KAF5610900.1 penicillin-binding protein [Fusarium subglutinans]
MTLPTKGNRTATTRDVIEYMLTQPLQFTPGEKKAYSNYEFMLLGYLHDRIIQESRLTGLDTLRPMSNRSVAAVYGGYGAIMEECAAAFSLKASASTIAKFAGLTNGIAVSGIGRRKNGYRRGNFEGARTHVESNGDFDFAVVFNTRDFAFDQEF